MTKFWGKPISHRTLYPGVYPDNVPVVAQIKILKTEPTLIFDEQQWGSAAGSGRRAGSGPWKMRFGV